jgi:pyruvate,water dikinase
VSTPGRDVLVSLDDPRAADAALVGAKAANLAGTRAIGLSVAPGVVLTTDAPDVASLRDELASAAQRLGPTSTPLVVRSSSTVEDIGTSSMAGQFRSVLDVRGPDALVEAIGVVQRSARRPDGSIAPMAVLIQPQIDATVGGVMFGVDPVTGDDRTIVVEAVAGNPDQLVSGQVSAHRLALTRKGRLRSIDGVPVRHRLHRHLTLLTAPELRHLASLAATLTEHYGRPQDAEWALDAQRSLFLLQTRPVTTQVAAPSGPTFGPGPIAETFPYPLRPLERDLWLTPMRDGIRRALSLVGVVPRPALARSPVLIDVDGWAAADLELFGYLARRPHGWGWIDPRPPARRLAAAWRVGSLRARLPDDIAYLLARTDEQVSSVRPLGELTDDQLLTVVESASATLVEMHSAEVLAASLTHADPGSLAGAALDALRRGRAVGRTDAQLMRLDPVVLTLVPPRIGMPRPLPAAVSAGPSSIRGAPGLRELTRLRVRWVHELQSRAVTTIGERARVAGCIAHDGDVAWLTLAELRALVHDRRLPTDLATRTASTVGPPLPAHFQLADDGTVVPVERGGVRPSGGVGAGGGRGSGLVVHADDVTPNAAADPTSAGRVLVVRTLDPTLAARLPGLAGLVSESGSTLSHLAILAREYRVPTVVAVHDAMHRFPPGSPLLVDGRTGEVRRLEEGES